MSFTKEWGPLIGLLFLLVGAKVNWPGERLDQIETRLTNVEAMRSDVEAMALSLCLQETNPIARQRLRCGTREAEAGIRR